MIVEFSQDHYGYFLYKVKANNGMVMLTSDGYSTYLKCVNGWRTVEKKLGVRRDSYRFRWLDTKNFNCK